MTNDIILTIAIPTYNRIGFLKTIVDCFIQQVISGGLANTVEIVVGNNASEDGTGEYLDQIIIQHHFLRRFNRPKNLGFSKNADLLVHEAKGEYVLICGDDDLMRAGAIEYCIKCILEKRPNFILINTSNITSFDNSNHDFKVILENRLRIDRDFFIEDLQKDHNLLKKVHNWLYLTNLLPAVIFKKELFIAEEISVKKYLRPENLYLWQAQVLIGISKYGRFLIIGQSFVLHRKNETSWTNDKRSVVFFDIFDNVEVANLIKDYIPTEYQKYKKLYAAFTVGGLMLETKNGKGVRKYAWSALIRNLWIFPENIQFLCMLVAPTVTTKISPQLRQYKRLLLN